MLDAFITKNVLSFKAPYEVNFTAMERVLKMKLTSKNKDDNVVRSSNYYSVTMKSYTNDAWHDGGFLKPKSVSCWFKNQFKIRPYLKKAKSPKLL